MQVENPPKTGSLVAYGAMVVATVVAFLVIREYGETLPAPDAASVEAAAAASRSPDIILHVLIALFAVIATGYIFGRLFAYVGQPPVIGEVVAGVFLGPSLLGVETSGLILPADVGPYLGVIAQIGVILYMFLVGLELDLDLVRQRPHATIMTSHASILLPFLLGALLALYLYPRLASADVPFTNFALFVGVAMSITAFPVLARILTDRRMARTRLGVVALTCAAMGDVTAWCLLAFVVGLVTAEGGEGFIVTVGALAYIAFMVVIARPILGRIVRSWPQERLSRDAIVLTFFALLVSAAATEAIGIHAIFGAFLLGAVIPHDSVLARVLPPQLDHIVSVLLLPAFFAFTGMRTRIDLLADVGQWLVCGLIILIATIGKFGGTLIAARLTGHTWRDSAILGTLMNTRGLMELIVLNIGLELGVISPALFAMMVLMALVSTVATAPVLSLLSPETETVADAEVSAIEVR